VPRALVLADQDSVPLLGLARHAILGAPEATQRKAIAILITDFRVNYGNSLAGFARGRHLADGHRGSEGPAGRPVQSILREKDREKPSVRLSAATQQFFDHSLRGSRWDFGDPDEHSRRIGLDLLGEAMRIRDAKFAAAAAAKRHSPFRSIS